MATVVLALSSMALLAACGGGGEGGGTSTPSGTSAAVTYGITLDAPKGVTVTGLPEKAAEGDRVSFTIAVENGVVIDKVTFNGEEITSTTSRYRFTMPAAAVTVKITVAELSGITVNAENVRKGFFVGNAFESEGLVVNTVVAGAEKPLTTGFTVSAEGLEEGVFTSEGTKTVTVSYSGFTATYTVQVGAIKGTDIDIVEKEGKAYFVIEGTYSTYASVADLTAAAKGMVKVDLQNNGAWTRFCQSDSLTFLDNGTGKFKVEVDVNDLPGSAGSGTGYILHFGLPNGNGGTGSESDIGQAGDMKFDVDSENTGKELTVGSRKYIIATNAGKEGQADFYGCPSLTVIDEAVPTANINEVLLEKDGEHLYVIAKGLFSNFDYTLDPNFDYFYLDMVELGGSWANVAEDIVWTFVPANAEDTTSGMFTAKFDVAGKLSSNTHYFFHYIFGEGAKTQSTDNHNLKWDNKSMVATTVAHETGSYSVEMISGVSGYGWADGLAGIYYLGGDYVVLDGVSLAAKEGRAIATLSGAFSGIEEGEDYYVDVMSFDNQVPDLEGKVTVTLDKEEGANNGTFSIDIDLTGLLVVDAVYYFHFGAIPEGGQYRPNVYKNLETSEVEASDGTYTLSTASGYSDSGDTWRNGLAVITYNPVK